MSHLFCLLQLITPQQLLTKGAGKLAASENPKLSQFFIQKFAKKYQPDLSAYERENLEDYTSFSDFFTRTFKPEQLKFPKDPSTLGSPVEGTVSQLGNIKNGQLLQAKGRYYTLIDLLAGEFNPNTYKQGHYLTAYLSPTNYHRVHMPIDGKLIAYTYIPGRLFSVAPSTLENCSEIFTRNERLVMHFETAQGPMALIMVGAYLVGQIHTQFTGRIARSATLNHQVLTQAEQVDYQKGDELGYFNFGSSIILLFPKGTVDFSKELHAQTPLSLGKNIGEQLQNPLASSKRTDHNTAKTTSASQT